MTYIESSIEGSTDALASLTDQDVAQMGDNQTEGQKQKSNHLEQQRRQQEQDHKTEATENQKSNGEESAVAVANQVINNIEGKPHLTHFRAHKNPEVHSDTEVNSFGGNPIHIADELMVDDGGNITLSTRAELANHCLRFAKYQAAVSIPGYKTIKR